MKKTLSFAVMHFSIAFGVAWLLTGDILVGGLVALVEPAVNSVAYFFHEKVWARRNTPRDRTIQCSVARETSAAKTTILEV